MSTVQPSIDATVDVLATSPASASLRRDTLRNVLRQRSAVIGMIILAGLILMAIFAPVIAPYDPIASMLASG